MGWKEIPVETAKHLGFQAKQVRKKVFGVQDGYPIQFLLGGQQAGSVDYLITQVRYDDPSKDAQVLDVLRKSTVLKERKMKTRGTLLQASGGVLTWQRAKGLFRTPKPEDTAGEVKALLGELKTVVPAPGLGCRLCPATPVEPVLVNGLVDRLCPACLKKLQELGRQADQAYEQLPLNLPMAVLSAVLLAGAGAALWATVAIATDRMFWLLAIGIGVGIAWGTVKAAGRAGMEVQVLVGVSTLLSVLLGEVLFIAHIVQKQAEQSGGQVNWVLFARAVPSLLVGAGADTAFTVMGALFGAWTGMKSSSKPKLEVEVEGG